jgi:hypothetical protein
MSAVGFYIWDKPEMSGSFHDHSPEIIREAR